MLKLLVILGALLCGALATQKSYTGYKVYSIKATTFSELDTLNAIAENAGDGLDFWSLHRQINDPVVVMVEPELQQSFESDLKNFDMKVLIENVEEVFAAERKFNEEKRAERLKQTKSTADLSYFWTYQEINDYLEELASEYPDIVGVESLGTTYEGREMKAVRISTSGSFSDQRPIIFLEATMHAREWIGPMTAVHLIHELVEHSEDYPEMLDDLDWIILPISNPDGYVHTHASERLWRKNRRVNSGSTCMGVDLNRNFDYQWDATGGASTSPCSDTFKGASAASEVEVQNISNLMAKYRSTALYLSLHSYGNYILYPYGYDYVLIENWEDHEEAGTIAQNAIYNVAGTVYTMGPSASTMYRTSGVSHDYAAGVGGFGMSYTWELPGGGSAGFDIPASRIPAVVAETFEGIRHFSKFIADKLNQE